MDRKLRLKGAILGVAFDVIVTANPKSPELDITGEAWGMPVDIKLVENEDNDMIGVTGTLLGNDFIINAADVADEPEAAPNQG